MRILIVSNMAPFTWGGAEELTKHLETALRDAGHMAEVIRIPFKWEPARKIPSQMLLVRGLEVENVDRVIALKFPAYLIRHPAKTLWLLHQFRQAYDLYDTGMSNLRGEPGMAIRSAIQAADAQTFGECRRIFTNSEVTKDRLAKFSGFDAEVLRPPLNDPELFTGGPSEGYVFVGGRVNAMKRQHVLLEAAALTPGARLLIAGPPDTPGDAERLERLVEEHGLADRVRLDLRFVPRPQIAAYVNGASSIACMPYDEDSLSYVAMEGAAAAKPILTTTDSGGVVRLVRDGETGLLAEPTPDAIAQGLARLGGPGASNAEMGLAARSLFSQLVPTWPQAVETLLA